MTAKPKTCAHCQGDLAGASIHTIQGIKVCADIRNCLARQAERKQQPAEATGGEQAQDGAAASDAVETVRAWVADARFDEELIELEAQTLRTVLADRDALAARVAELEGERSKTTCAFPGCLHPDHQRNAAPPEQAAGDGEAEREAVEAAVERFSAFLGVWCTLPDFDDIEGLYAESDGRMRVPDPTNRPFWLVLFKSDLLAIRAELDRLRRLEQERDEDDVAAAIETLRKAARDPKRCRDRRDLHICARLPHIGGDHLDVQGWSWADENADLAARDGREAGADDVGDVPCFWCHCDGCNECTGIHGVVCGCKNPVQR